MEFLNFKSTTPSDEYRVMTGRNGIAIPLAVPSWEIFPGLNYSKALETIVK